MDQGNDRLVNSTRVHLKREVARFARETPPGSYVLDAGAGKAPYRHLFKHTHYETADFAQLPSSYTQLDYVCDLTDIPTEDQRFARIIFNQVLEHLPEPQQALAELFRVLKPGGKIFCSAPLFYAEHQKPYDFYRYTRFGLERLFKAAGFENLRVEWLEGYFGTIAYQFRMMARNLPRDMQSLRAMGLTEDVSSTILMTQRTADLLARTFSKADVAHAYKRKGMPKNYMLIAERP